MVPITMQFQWLQVIDGVIGICPPNIWHPFMEMAGKQFSPFMEMVVPHSFTTVQPSLTACVIVSYKLCNCVLRLMEMVSKQFSNL